MNKNNGISAEALTIATAIDKRRDYEAKAREIKKRSIDENRDMTSAEFQIFNDYAQAVQMYNDVEERLAKPEEFPAMHVHGENRNDTDAIGRAILSGGFTDRELRDLTVGGAPGHLKNPSLVDTNSFVMAMKEHPFLADTGVQVRNISNFHQWPVQTGNPVITWQSAEGASVTPDTGLTIGSKKIEKKTWAIIVKYSKQLARDEQITPTLIRQTILNEVVAMMQGVALYGASGSNQPEGLDNITGVLTVDAAGTISSYAKIIEAVKALHAVNVDPRRLALVTGTTAMSQIISLADSTGQPLMPPPIIKDIPFHFTSSVLESYDTSTHTRAYMADWTQMVIGVDGPHVENWTQKYGDELNNAVLVWGGIDVVALRPNNFCRIENIDLA